MPLRGLQLVLLLAVIVYSSTVSLNEAELLLVFRKMREEGRAKGCRRALDQKRRPIAFYIELRCDT